MTTASKEIVDASSVPARRIEPMSLRLYVGGICLLGAAWLWVPGTWDAATGMWFPALIALTFLSIALEFVIVPLPAGGSFSMATISHVATILLVPAPFAAISIALSVLVEETVRKAPTMKMLFNVAGMVLTASLASFAMGLIGSVWGAVASDTTVTLLPLFAVVALVYFVVNAVLLSVVFAITEHEPMISVLRRSAGGTLLGELATTATGAHLALLWVIQPLIVLVLAIPAIAIARSFEHIRRLNTETRSAVKSLAEIVDHRDTSTYHHSERVAENAVRLARSLSLPETDVELIEQAASVHDLGKIGVPDAVLLKPGRLTAGETARMRRHTELGAEILTRFRLFRPGAEIVRHHHERWDGAGYPDGLAGESIPLGARVVAVADAFDAMTATRPYRKALSRREALRRLAEGAGTQWDPRIVHAFLAMVARKPSTPRRARASRVARTGSAAARAAEIGET